MDNKRVALIEGKPSRNSYDDFDFDFDRYALTSDPNAKKVLKKNIDIKIDIDAYDWVILVGSEAFKEYTGKTSVMEFSGKLVNDKFLPAINPAMLRFKPEVRQTWENSVESITAFIDGTAKMSEIPYKNYIGITDRNQALKYIQEAIDHPNEYVGVDSETTALYPRDGYVLGISLSYRLDHGAYIHSDVIDEEVTAKFQELFNKKKVVFHNAKFDIAFLTYHFGFKFPNFEDTMLMHYALDERTGTHGLKKLAIQYTIYGEYEEELTTWVKEYCKKTGILKSDFTWDKIPFDIMKTYAAIDPAVTLILFSKFLGPLKKNEKLWKVYKEILIPGTMFVIDLQNNGIPFDIERLQMAQDVMNSKIEEAVRKLESYDEVIRFKKDKGEFNPNSVMQLRELLFEYIGLPPTSIKTGKGLPSTNSEVLELLAKEHPIPDLILTIRRYSKIKNTYIDKILPNLNSDGRLRTNFNLHSTTSGRLSSSGKLNAQQLPRDEPTVKGCIKAKLGYKIVSMDLTTAEVYVAACLSGDEKLKDIFRRGGDFHGRVAHAVFKLKCKVEDVKKLFPNDRQAAKAVTFGIMYGAGPVNIAEQITANTGNYCSKSDAAEIINDYFKEFKQLKTWIENNQKFIAKNGFVYSYFGRKRRLRNVFSDNKGTIGHEIRSGLNFLVQSPASDINLIGAMECNQLLESKGLSKVEMIALVHDSVIAHVPEELIEPYCKLLKECIQRDRGISIPGTPIGCDFEIGDDYSFGKYEKLYNETN